MKSGFAVLLFVGAAVLSSCGRNGSSESPQKSAAEAPASAPAAAQPAGGPHALVHLKDGSKVPGTIVASTQTDMVVAGDDGIERRIPLTQVKSVEYPEKSEPSQAAAREPAAPKRSPQREAQAPKRAVEEAPKRAAEEAPRQAASEAAQQPPSAPAATPQRQYEVPAGTDISVRTNEAIDSASAAEGQTFDAQLTRNVEDANGDVVIPRGATARIVIKSASKGGRFHGASDLVVDLQSVVIHGRPYEIAAADISQKGKAGVGANKRTAQYTGGGAALGAIIGAIAGGGKGAAIGAGAGAGAGALTQIITKGGAIKIPAESVLTFRLDKPLVVTAEQ